jgi:hypothetical protein
VTLKATFRRLLHGSPHELRLSCPCGARVEMKVAGEGAWQMLDDVEKLFTLDHEHPEFAW